MPTQYCQAVVKESEAGFCVGRKVQTFTAVTQCYHTVL